MMYLGAVGATCAVLAGPGAAADPLAPDYYGHLSAIDDPSLSPDGTKIAFITVGAGVRCAVVRDFAQSKPLTIQCPQGTEEVQWVHWKSNERVLMGLYGSYPFGHKLVRGGHIAAVNIDGSHSIEVVDSRQGHLINYSTDRVVDFLDSDPNHILAQVFSISQSEPRVVKIDINSGDQDTVLKETDDIRSWIGDGSGRVRLGRDVVDGKWVLAYRDQESSPFSIVPPSPVLGPFVWPIAASDRDNAIYAKSAVETGRMSIYLFDAQQGKVVDRIASDPKYDIGDGILSHGRFVGYYYTDDRLKQVFTDPNWKNDQAVIQKALPGQNIWLADRTADGHRVLAFASVDAEPNILYLLDRVAGKPTTLNPIGSTQPLIPAWTVAKVKPVDYRARDGLLIHGYVTMPPGPPSKGPIPFVVLPHGGPFARDILAYDALAQMIASRGYGVLQPNFRGSTGYGVAFQAAGFEEWGLHMQDDVTDGTKWLIDQKLADPQRIGIVGWSYGGYAALMGAIKEPNLYRCVASMAGVTDLHRVYSVGAQGAFGRSDAKLEGDTAHIDENSPVQQADKISVPVLLLAGKMDFIVPVADAQKMEKALKDANKNVEAVYFPDDDHYLFHEANKITLMTKIAGFLKTNLGPGVGN